MQIYENEAFFISEDRDYLDFPEFLTVLAFHLQETEPEEQLREAFKVFDKDGNGKLNANELKQSMTNLGERLSKEDIEYMIKMADVTGDGTVNYEGIYYTCINNNVF
jgi:calmodulin